MQKKLLPHEQAVRVNKWGFKKTSNLSPDEKKLLQNTDHVLRLFGGGLADSVKVEKLQGAGMNKVDEYIAIRPGSPQRK